MKPRNFAPLRRALALGPALRVKSGKQVFWQVGGRRKFSCEAVNALIAAGEAARIEDRLYSLKQLEDELCRTTAEAAKAATNTT